MTENEAIKYLEFHKKGLHDTGYNAECVNFAIQALKEIQQYRAIGTVAIFEQLSKQFAPHNTDETSCNLRNCNKCDMYRKENEKYHAIGTIEEFNALKEKSVAKKPVNKHKRFDVMGFCPSCQMDVYYPSQTNYCSHCGQKLDWND